MCGCAAWMPTTIGNIFKNTIEDLLSSPLARSIRESIRQGTYRYCNEVTCGIIANNQLLTPEQLAPDFRQRVMDPMADVSLPKEIFLAGDLTCNLSCPSCRTEVIKTSREFVDKQRQLGDQLRKNLFSRPSDREISLRLSSSGEVFASPLLLEFVNEIPVDDYPNLQLKLHSNGLLCERNWHRLGVAQDRVERITVTVDACQADTYERLRRGGKWVRMMRSLRWLQQKKHSNGMKLILRMVVQKDNYMEMQGFYDLAQAHDADAVEYCRITNWGTFSAGEFQDVDVFDQHHPQLNQAQQQLMAVRNLPGVLVSGGL